MSTTKNSRTPRTRQARNKRRKPATGWNYPKLIAFVVVVILLTTSSAIFKNAILHFLFTVTSTQPTQGDFAGTLIYEAINLQHSIRENPNNKEQLLQRLAEPVRWYSRQNWQHRELKFGSDYDRFAFVNELRFDKREFSENNYEVRFDGMYRYREPKDKLVAFESGTAVIERGRITALTSFKNPNEYRHTWLNDIYRWYYLFAFLSAFGFALIIFTFPWLVEALVRRVQKLVG
jgi:hypothetical protein